MITTFIVVLFFIVGIILGWLGGERYVSFILQNKHEFEDIMKQNPHPEIFDKNGKLNKGDYLSITFEPGYDPEEFDPDDVSYEGGG